MKLSVSVGGGGAKPPAYWVVDHTGRTITMRRDIHDALRIAEDRAKLKGATMVLRDGRILALCSHTEGFSADEVLKRLHNAERRIDRHNERIANHIASQPKIVTEDRGHCSCGDKSWIRCDGPDQNTLRCPKCEAYAFWKYGGWGPRIALLFCRLCHKPATSRRLRKEMVRFEYYCTACDHERKGAA